MYRSSLIICIIRIIYMYYSLFNWIYKMYCVKLSLDKIFNMNIVVVYLFPLYKEIISCFQFDLFNTYSAAQKVVAVVKMANVIWELRFQY